jgi:hypothetical protein
MVHKEKSWETTFSDETTLAGLGGKMTILDLSKECQSYKAARN